MESCHIVFNKLRITNLPVILYIHRPMQIDFFYSTAKILTDLLKELNIKHQGQKNNNNKENNNDNDKNKNKKTATNIDKNSPTVQLLQKFANHRNLPFSHTTYYVCITQWIHDFSQFQNIEPIEHKLKETILNSR